MTVRASGYQAVDLRYAGGDLSMLVLLPDRSDGLPELDHAISAGMIRDCMGKMLPRDVGLYLPRFKLTWGALDLRDSLVKMGMKLAFDSRLGDFSGINGRVPPDADALFISAVLHKAFVDVNEEGTEAAAATAVAGHCSAMPDQEATPIFRADHPFLFAILDRNTGSILFLGRVADPTQGA